MNASPEETTMKFFILKDGLDWPREWFVYTVPENVDWRLLPATAIYEHLIPELFDNDQIMDLIDGNLEIALHYLRGPIGKKYHDDLKKSNVTLGQLADEEFFDPTLHEINFVVNTVDKRDPKTLGQ